MILGIVICACVIVVCCDAQCYDRITRESYTAGETYTKIKPLGEYTGTYNCVCRHGGMMYCTAVDIPCRDMVTGKFFPKEERFNAILRGRNYNCVCKGDRGRFENCLPGHIGSADGGCRDINGKAVENGEQYLARKYSTVVRCVCKNGIAARESCEKVCIDHETNEVVAVGETFTLSSFRRLYTCQCAEQGRPTSCRPKLRHTVVVDACRSGRPNCDVVLRATCTPRGNSYTCQCKDGYDGNGRICTDVNECLGDHRCDENAQCSNTEGYYTCTCNEGYSGDGYLCIRQIQDFCIENAVFCDVNARCETTDYSFLCICGEGYTGSGLSCDDHDECTGDHGCDINASCNNTLGSYLCFCKYGYSGDGHRCQQMCQDEGSGMYIQQNHVFQKVKNGRRMTCTCGENGEDIEGSCFGGTEEEEEEEEEQEEESDPAAPGGNFPPVERGCHDSLTGQMVESGHYFTKREENVEYRCRCVDGEQVLGSCKRLRNRQSNSGVVCRKGSGTYLQDESYERTFRGKTYVCTCTERRGSAVSRCRPQ